MTTWSDDALSGSLRLAKSIKEPGGILMRQCDSADSSFQAVASSTTSSCNIQYGFSKAEVLGFHHQTCGDSDVMSQSHSSRPSLPENAVGGLSESVLTLCQHCQGGSRGWNEGLYASL